MFEVHFLVLVVIIYDIKIKSYTTVVWYNVLVIGVVAVLDGLLGGQHVVAHFLLQLVSWRFPCVFAFLLDPTGVFVGFLAFFLLNGIGVSISLFFLNVEPLEKSMEIEMFKVVRTQRQLGNDKFNVFIFKFQFLEHGDKILLANCVITIFDVFEGSFKLIGIGAGHLSDPHDHIFLLTLLHQLEIINNLSQFRY